MKPIAFAQANRILTAPAGVSEEECGPLPTFTDGEVCISAWQPSAEDLERLAQGEPLWLCVSSGQATQPPVMLLTESPFKEFDHSVH